MSEVPAALVDIRHVTKTYHNHVEVHALRDVTLSLEAGSFAAVVGPSGSGKSTLLHLLGALDRPDQGTIRIAGIELTTTPADQLAEFRLHRIGFVFQAFNLLPVLSVEENLEFVAALQGSTKEARRHRTRELLRAILTEPAIVLADEPTANLDSANASLLLDMMERMNRQKGITFLFSTHDPQVMERARRLIRLRDGTVIADEMVDRASSAGPA
jgi:putative ABC transport system ATP-binding protein